MSEAYSGSNFLFDVLCPPVLYGGLFSVLSKISGTSSKFAMIRAASRPIAENWSGANGLSSRHAFRYLRIDQGQVNQE
jgi:hypothetical protein